MQNDKLNRENIVSFLADIFNRVGTDSYLGEEVTMSEHMLQAAQNAERAGESNAIITAALLHDIGHYTGEFPENYIDLGLNNRHETMGAAILEKFFPEEVTQPVRWHVDAKRYLCAVQPDYFHDLSEASVKTLKLQGGPMSQTEAGKFAKNPYADAVVRVRRYDDGGKVPGVSTPTIDHYLNVVQQVLDDSADWSGPIAGTPPPA